MNFFYNLGARAKVYVAVLKSRTYFSDAVEMTKVIQIDKSYYPFISVKFHENLTVPNTCISRFTTPSIF